MPLRIFLSGLLLLTALGLGLIGYQVTRPPKTVMVTAVADAPPPPLTIDVLVAARSLPAGTLMKEEDFTKRAVPSGDVPKGALTDTPETRGDLRGALLRHYLDANNVLMSGDVLHPRDRGFLAAVLTPGTRAISVGVDAITGDGGLIWPGDRVDLILTQQMDDKDTPLAKRFVSETVLSDVRVVAVDQSIAQGAVAAGDNTTGRLARTVTSGSDATASRASGPRGPPWQDHSRHSCGGRSGGWETLGAQSMAATSRQRSPTAARPTLRTCGSSKARMLARCGSHDLRSSKVIARQAAARRERDKKCHVCVKRCRNKRT